MNKPATKPLTRIRGAVIYTRVSTGEQEKHGTSPETQLAACRTKALALNLPIVAEYHDGGISGGFLLTRAGMQSALADIQTGRADTLICPNLSRYSRDVEHQQAVKKAVKAAGGRLVFCDADFEDTAAGDLNFAIQGGFAEYERKVIRERTMSGRQRRAESGQQPARAKSPFGYHIVTKADVLRGVYPHTLIGQYQVVEEHAGIVREVFARYAAGTHSLNQVAKWLNTAGIKPPGNAAYWWASGLHYLISNTVYKGEAHYGQRTHRMEESRLQQVNPQTGQPYKQSIVRRPSDPEAVINLSCPPIVSEEVWEQANTRLSQNQYDYGGNPLRVRMLTGKVVCPACGGRMMICGGGKNTYISAKGNPIYYRSEKRYGCNYSRKLYCVTGQHSCTSATFMVRRMEEAVITAILSAAERPEAIAEAVRAYHAAEARRETGGQGEGQAKGQNDPAHIRRGKAKVEEALTRLETRQEATVKAQISGIMAGADPGAYNAVFAEIAAERKDLEDRRGVLARALKNLDLKNIEQKKAVPEKAVPQVSSSKGGVNKDLVNKDLATRALAVAYEVLNSETVPSAKKREIIGKLVDKVICQTDGAKVVFLPGVVVPSETLKASGILSASEYPGRSLSAEDFLPDTLQSISMIFARTKI